MKDRSNLKFRVQSLKFKVQSSVFRVCSRLGLLTIVAAFSFFSCDSKRVFEANVDLPKRDWHIDSIPAFRFRVEDASKPYNLLINLRNSEAYPYYNLYLRYYLLDSTQREIKSQQVELILMDPKTGKPTGDGLGDIYSHKYQLLGNFVFPKQGEYVVKLKQYMRQDPLPEINSVGIRLEDFVSSEKK